MGEGLNQKDRDLWTEVLPSRGAFPHWEPDRWAVEECSRRLFSIFGGHLKEGKPSTSGISTRQQSVLEPPWARERDLKGNGKVWRIGHTEVTYGRARKGAGFSGPGGQNGRWLSPYLNPPRDCPPGEAHTQDRGWGVTAYDRSHRWSSGDVWKSTWSSEELVITSQGHQYLDAGPHGGHQRPTCVVKNKPWSENDIPAWHRKMLPLCCSLFATPKYWRSENLEVWRKNSEYRALN